MNQDPYSIQQQHRSRSTTALASDPSLSQQMLLAHAPIQQPTMQWPAYDGYAPNHLHHAPPVVAQNPTQYMRGLNDLPTNGQVQYAGQQHLPGWNAEWNNVPNRNGWQPGKWSFEMPASYLANDFTQSVPFLPSSQLERTGSTAAAPTATTHSQLRARRLPVHAHVNPANSIFSF
jgi:hypothetical protein